MSSSAVGTRYPRLADAQSLEEREERDFGSLDGLGPGLDCDSGVKLRGNLRGQRWFSRFESAGDICQARQVGKHFR